MERETLSSITCPKAIWLYDSVSRYPDMMENWELYDLHYVFEESDVLKLKEKNKESVFLPLGYDEQKILSNKYKYKGRRHKFCWCDVWK